MRSQAQQKRYIEKVIYRKFSEIRYKKYRHQYPRWSESYVVERIIKDWSDMSEEQKKVVMILYENKKIVDSDDDQSSSSSKINQLTIQPKQNQMKQSKNNLSLCQIQKSALPNLQNKQQALEIEAKDKVDRLQSARLESNYNSFENQNIPRQKIQLAIQNPFQNIANKEPPLGQLQQITQELFDDQIENTLIATKIQNEHRKDSNKLQVNKNSNKLQDQKQQRFTKNQQQKIKTKKDKSKQEECFRLTKIIQQKQQHRKKTNQYLKFYVFYYKRISAKHPQLTNNNITKAVQHLWKQRKLHNLQKKKAQKQTNRLQKMSGRQLFFRENAKQGLKYDQIKMKWLHLPFQAKLYWTNRKSCLNQALEQSKNIIYKATFPKTYKHKLNRQLLLNQQLFQQLPKNNQSQQGLQDFQDEKSQTNQNELEINDHENPFHYIDKLITMSS